MVKVTWKYHLDWPYLRFVSDTVCKTKDNHACIIPFEYERHNFSTCNNQPRKDLPSNSFWCPIDENYKSVGVCRDSCPKSKNDPLHEFSCCKIHSFQFVDYHLDQLVMVMEQRIVQLLFATAN